MTNTPKGIRTAVILFLTQLPGTRPETSSQPGLLNGEGCGLRNAEPAYPHRWGHRSPAIPQRMQRVPRASMMPNHIVGLRVLGSNWRLYQTPPAPSPGDLPGQV